jgi:hypothetical protein
MSARKKLGTMVCALGFCVSGGWQWDEHAGKLTNTKNDYRILVGKISG